MIEAFKKAGLPEPIFEELAGGLQVTLLKDIYTEEYLRKLEALIFTANCDPLRDEGKAYAKKLSAACVETIYKNYENIHGFFGLGKMGEEALKAACDFLKKTLFD